MEYQYTNDTYPVVVFIHGGDFQSGGGSDYSQQAILDNFVSRKIIFVTFNYRLGPLGGMKRTLRSNSEKGQFVAKKNQG
ncbi:hypothetical protein COOONC_00150 [Cooperia oncophora]